MSKLKIDSIEDDKPVTMTIKLPAAVHRNLIAYAEILARESNHPINDPVKLIAPMLASFTRSDRAFAKARRAPANIRRRRTDSARRVVVGASECKQRVAVRLRARRSRPPVGRNARMCRNLNSPFGPVQARVDMQCASRTRATWFRSP